MEKQQKESERAKMKRRVMQRDVKWMEELKKRQADRNKAARKAEEAAEAERIRLKALVSCARRISRRRDGAQGGGGTRGGDPVRGRDAHGRLGTPRASSTEPTP